MSWKMRGGSCVMSSTNGRWDEAGPGMLRTNGMPGCGHVTGFSQSRAGDAARDAGVGRARWCQPIREEQLHLMRGRDTDMCGGWREHVRQRWLGQWYSRRCYDKPYLLHISKLYPLVLWVNFLSFTKTSHVLCQGFWHQPMRCYNIPTQPGGRLWPYVASWHHPMMAGMWKYTVQNTAKDEERRGTCIFHLLFYSDQLARMCNT